MYAITTDEDLFDGFQRQRDPSLFIYKERKIKKDESSLIPPRYWLGKKELKTKDKNSVTGFDFVPMILTYGEEFELVAKSDRIHEEMIKYVSRDAIVFNDEIIKALDTLYFWQFLKIAQSSPLLSGIDVDYDFMAYEVDQLSLFIKLFGYTLRKGD